MSGSTPIDNLIEHLKSQRPYDPTSGYRLWEAFEILHSDINRLFNTILVSETPVGTINGTNRTFTLSNIPVDILILVHNGLVITTYALNNKVITMNIAPIVNDTLLAIYKKAGQ